jgi:hypothetical protein
MVFVYSKVLAIVLVIDELRIKAGRKVLFSKIGTLEQCKEWIEYWNSFSSCYDYEYTYTLYPKKPDILQD